MKRHGTAGGKAANLRRRKAASRKRRTAPKLRPNRGLAAAGLQEQLDRRTQELNEALERQAATSEVLSVISSSRGELEPVFQAILKNATRICEAKFGSLFLFEGNEFHFVAEVDTPLEHADFQRRRGSFPTRAGSPLDRLVRTKQVVTCNDILSTIRQIRRQNLAARAPMPPSRWSRKAGC